jgi:gas vesicle protein
MNYEEDRQDALGSNAAFFMGLAAGAVIGAGIGLLFAPRKGSEIRSQVSDAAANFGQTVQRTADDVVEQSRQWYGRARDAVSQTAAQADRFVRDAQSAAKEGFNAARDAATERIQNVMRQ